MFVFIATEEQGRNFLGRYGDEARGIADPSGALFDAFDVPRARLGQVFGPSVWVAGARAASRGHGIGKPVGDVMRMPGAFLLQGSRILWQHDYRHAGDKPDWASLRAAV
ncbi:MAG: hypothetical protein AAGD14_09615 [Planctomycetota bacterium]